MQLMATNVTHCVVCLSVFMLVMRMCCAKTGEAIDSCLVVESCGSKELRIRWGQDRTNPFTVVRGDKLAMWLFAHTCYYFLCS